MKGEAINCPECKSEAIKKNGNRKTQNRGIIQRYKCNSCDYRFTKNDGFFRMRNSPQKITLCLDLFFRGISTRKVQEHLQAFYPHNSSHKSIYKWVIRYSRQISNFTDNLKLKVGKEIQVDEMEYHRRKAHNKKGIDKNWFIDVIDTKTRFMVASNYVKTRGEKGIKEVMKIAKYKTDNQVDVITSDGFNAYPKILRNTFNLNKKQAKSKIKHNIVNASKGEGFNIMIERLHNNIRQRTKIFRGFHGSIESANSIMKGYEIYYNFITKHQTLKKCPYELAIPELKLNTENKWIELIKLSTITS
nr:IS1/IS6 family transposase [Candidatus Woesearchaeota archaeon]